MADQIPGFSDTWYDDDLRQRAVACLHATVRGLIRLCDAETRRLLLIGQPEAQLEEAPDLEDWDITFLLKWGTLFAILTLLIKLIVSLRYV